jgi:DNA-directed RNA polymerase specialized sigma24 family protein
MLTQVIQRELNWFYPWLRKLSGALMAHESKSHTLQPTALANEVLSKLLAWRGGLSGNEEHSLRLLAITIAKQTLVDHGRRRSIRETRWQQVCEVYRTRIQRPSDASVQTRLSVVIEAIEELESIDTNLASMVRLRFFEGYNLQQIAQILQLSPRTAARRWAA